MKKERAELVDKNHPKLSVRTQCKLLHVTRSSLDYEPVLESEEDRKIMRLMDEIYLIDPCIGTRRMVALLKRDYGLKTNRKRIRRLRRKMGLETIWCRPCKTSIPDKAHRKYPYLLHEMKVTHPDQVWCADITYIPMPRGHAYLCVVMDWYSRKVLGWHVSNTIDTRLCLAALAMAVEQSGKLPEIFNADQGSQFTSEEWIQELLRLGIAIRIVVGDPFADGLPRRFNGLKGLDIEGRVGGDVDNALPKSMEPEEKFDFSGALERVDGMQRGLAA